MSDKKTLWQDNEKHIKYIALVGDQFRRKITLNKNLQCLAVSALYLRWISLPSVYLNQENEICFLFLKATSELSIMFEYYDYHIRLTGYC